MYIMPWNQAFAKSGGKPGAPVLVPCRQVLRDLRIRENPTRLPHCDSSPRLVFEFVFFDAMDSDTLRAALLAASSQGYLKSG